MKSLYSQDKVLARLDTLEKTNHTPIFGDTVTNGSSTLMLSAYEALSSTLKRTKAMKGTGEHESYSGLHGFRLSLLKLL